MLLYLSEGILIFTKSFSVLQFAEICNTKDTVHIWRITLGHLKKSIISALLIAICWCLFPVHFLKTLMDAPLDELQEISFYIIPGILLQSMSIIYLHHFSGTGYFRFNFYNAFFTFGAGCIAFCLTIPLMENPVQAAALSLSCAWIVQWLTYVMLMQRWKRLEQIQ
jgi:O-antigen/teichoic acid export membrane protein